MRKRTARLGNQANDTLRTQLKENRRWDGPSDKNCIVRQFLERRRGVDVQVMKQPANDVVEISSTLAQIFVLQLVISFEQLVAHLLNRPLRIDLAVLNLVDDPVDEQFVLENQQVGIDQERRLRSAAFLQLL